MQVLPQPRMWEARSVLLFPVRVSIAVMAHATIRSAACIQKVANTITGEIGAEEVNNRSMLVDRQG
jgi:hypothetical protein